MAEQTKIQWADSTFNLSMGCDGCELWRAAKLDELSPTGWEAGASQRPDGRWWIRICYAGVDTDNKTAKNATRPGGPLKGWPLSFDTPTIFPERIKLLEQWKDLTGTVRPHEGPYAKPWFDFMPRSIFWIDMGDGFTVSLPVDWLAPYLPAVAKSPHRHLWLTKRPDRAAEFSLRHLLPENVELGTSITGQQDARLRALGRARVARRFVSYEPVLRDAGDVVRRHPEIGWWLIGGASGQSAPPTDVNVVRDVIVAGREVGSAIFVKQLGAEPYDSARSLGTDVLLSRLALAHPKGGDWNEWPAEFRVRQVPGLDGGLF